MAGTLLCKIEGAGYLALQGERWICAEQNPVCISDIAADLVSRVRLPEYLCSLLVDDCLTAVRSDGELEHDHRDIASFTGGHDWSPGMCMDMVSFPENAGVTWSR